jgi:hypothetical protein
VFGIVWFFIGKWQKWADKKKEEEKINKKE